MHSKVKAFDKKSFCFISETARRERPILDPSVRYRCFHPAEALMKAGFQCAIYSASQFYKLPSYDFDVYIFHRPNVAHANFRKTFERLSQLGRVLVADYDDLIFGDEKTALISSAVKNNTLTPEVAISAFQFNLEAMRLFGKVTTSTAALGAIAGSFNPGAEIITRPNHISDSIVKLHSDIGTATRSRSKNQIGYFAGTKSHDRDFPVVEEVLHRVLSENPDFNLLVVGPVTLPAGIASLPNITVTDAVGYWRLPHLMAHCHTSIAPLESSAFNDCKSRVKFLEAALSGCRLIASPIPDMRIIGSDHMVLADSKDDWYNALSFPEQDQEHQDMVQRNLEFIQAGDPAQVLLKIGGLA